MLSFNLIDQPWIPSMMAGDPIDVSLRDVLHQAQEIDEIADPSPLVTVAIHRLLLAVLHRVYGPKSEEQWADMWEARAWRLTDLDAYLDDWHDRFDLFNDAHPFYQAADIVAGDHDQSAYELVHELGATNDFMFSHVSGSAPPDLTAQEAARYLLAFQAFTPGGLVRDRFKPGPTSARQGTLTGSAVCLVTGDNLFETLMLNMVRYNPAGNQPFANQRNDTPAWEREEPPDDSVRLPNGYLDWLTWQSRAIRLQPVEEHGSIAVRHAVKARGNQLPTGVTTQEFETMVAFKERKNAKPNEEPYIAVAFRRNRALWRDSTALFQSVEAERPRTLDELSNHIAGRSLYKANTFPLTLSGIALDQYNVLFWRSEHLPLPLAYLQDKPLYDNAKRALDVAQDAGQAVRDATRHLAAYLLHVNLETENNRSRREAVDKRQASMSAERRYWSSLEPHFSRYLVDAAEQQERDNGSASGANSLLRDWEREVMRAARQSFAEVAEGLGPDGNILQVIECEARPHLERGLSHARKHIPPAEARQGAA